MLFMDTRNEYGTLEIQKELLNLLRVFHKFCQDNNIQYSLAWGSLLGAIRHKGFIPWDDDLDVMMDRKNYNKFVLLSSKSKVIKVEKLLWIDRVRLREQITKWHREPTLDILLIDNAPDNSIARKLRLFAFMALQGMLKKNPNFSKGSIVMRICTLGTFITGKLFPDKLLLKWYTALSQWSNGKQTEKLASYNTEFVDLPKLYSKTLMDDFLIVPFEDTEASIVKEYASCLTVMFGPDYMTPPPVQERIPRH